MRILGHLAFAGVSLAALSAPAFAQGAPATEEVSNEDIIVQARRRDESLQDVPLTVNAVTSETIEKLNLRELKDITAVVPGLVLQSGNRTTGVVASLRGLNVDVNSSGANTSVQFYLNDAVINAGAALQAMYDVGQIEVLRGPQGTLRGLASPSGSITITTRRPDMTEWGGYAMGTATTVGALNVNGAVNAPILPDLLALRVAGLLEENDANDIPSINNPGLRPSAKTKAIRASLRFTPTNNIEIDASYSHLTKNFIIYDQVESAYLADPTRPVTPLPATDRLITARDRLAVSNVPNDGHQAFDIFNWRAQWSFAGQRLNYVGNYYKQDFRSTEPYDKGDYFGATVAGDASLPNNNGTYNSQPAGGLNAQNVAQPVHSYSTQETHELRLSSEERLFNTVDYVVGLFMTKLVPWSDLLSISAVNPPVVSTSAINRRGRTIERAAFGNLTVHLGQGTEISGGVRFINYKTSTNNSSVATPFGADDTFKATVWTASAKHRFNDDLMIYASAGSSFRVGSGTNGLILLRGGVLPDTVRDPYLASLYPNTPERSKSYEIGLRSTWFDKKLMVNVSAFHQDFSGYIFPVAPFFILNNPTNANPVPVVQANVVRAVSSLTIPVPAKIDGVEAEIAFRPSERFNLSATFAYANARVTNGQIPCTFTTTPVAATTYTAPNQQVALCTVNQSASRIAPFSATMNGEYNMPITDAFNGFVRGLVQFYGNSTNDAANPFDDVPAYALVNLYAGIRTEDNRLEVTGYVKNLFNTFRVTSRDAAPQSVRTSATVNSNYRLVTVTEPREFGITARYAFGSR